MESSKTKLSRLKLLKRYRLMADDVKRLGKIVEHDLKFVSNEQLLTFNTIMRKIELKLHDLNAVTLAFIINERKSKDGIN